MTTSPAADQPLSRCLADFIAGLQVSDMPAPILAKATDHALDTLGAMLAGGGATETVLATTMLRAAGETGDVPLAGQSGPGLAPRAAALVNGIAAHAYELDDTGGCDHSGAVVWPAILSVLATSARPVAGAELLAAMIAGYEIGRRVMLGFGGYKPHNSAGWHSTGTCGAFAAAAAAARLLGLDPPAVQNALGLAGSMASGTWAFIHDGAMSKRVHAGHAAQAGMTAALMAQQGMNGPAQIFEDVWGGFFVTYGGPARPDPTMMAGLGRDWMISAAAIKPHASCRDTHAAIDAVARVQARTGIGAEQIRAIRARLSPFLIGMVGGKQIDTLPAAQMSLPWGIAARLCFGHAGLSAYGEAERRDPRALGLLDRISIIEDESVTASWASSVTFELTDGRVIEEPTATPLGAPENPLSASALRAKFDGLAAHNLTPARAEQVADLVMGLAGAPDARPLAAALAQ